jgi:hypothetical protein
LDLGFNDADVKKELAALNPRDYLKTCADRKRSEEEPPFWIFEKEVKGKSVYIKFKIRNTNDNIFVMSFHYPKYSIQLNEKPYA